MKLKNIKVGDYIEAKNNKYAVIQKGQLCKVVAVDMDNTVEVCIPSLRGTCTRWVNPADFRKPRPELKQLDQSVFDGAHEMWKFAAVDADGALFRFAERPDLTDNYWANANCSRFDRVSVAGIYDASNWQNSLIERDDIAKELLEVDLSSELTGSDLCRAMLERGDRFVMCRCADRKKPNGEYLGAHTSIISSHSELGFDIVHTLNQFKYATPINNMGEPLTAKDVGL